MLRKAPIPESSTIKESLLSRIEISTLITFECECSIALLNISENAKVEALEVFTTRIRIIERLLNDVRDSVKKEELEEKLGIIK